MFLSSATRTPRTRNVYDENGGGAAPMSSLKGKSSAATPRFALGDITNNRGPSGGQQSAIKARQSLATPSASASCAGKKGGAAAAALEDPFALAPEVLFQGGEDIEFCHVDARRDEHDKYRPAMNMGMDAAADETAVVAELEMDAAGSLDGPAAELDDFDLDDLEF